MWPLAVRRREQGAVNRTWCKAHVPRGGKRLVDLLLSSLLLLLLTPFLVIIGGLVRLTLGAILFCQQRLGQHGQPFVVFKFRTMLNVYDMYGQPLPDAAQLPGSGRPAQDQPG